MNVSNIKESMYKFKSMIFIMIIIWVSYIISIAIPSINSVIGIIPREVKWGEILAICFSWAGHRDFNHISGNSFFLIPMLFFISLFEKKPNKTLIMLILSSGIYVWIFGESNSIHVGASGLVYACFGYIISSIIFCRKYMYIIPVIISFVFYGVNYMASIYEGLMIKEDVSFSAHFGGLVVGILVSIALNKIIDKE